MRHDIDIIMRTDHRINFTTDGFDITKMTYKLFQRVENKFRWVPVDFILVNINARLRIGYNEDFDFVPNKTIFYCDGKDDALYDFDTSCYVSPIPNYKSIFLLHTRERGLGFYLFENEKDYVNFKIRHG